jgi:hypothetical protein
MVNVHKIGEIGNSGQQCRLGVRRCHVGGYGPLVAQSRVGPVQAQHRKEAVPAGVGVGSCVV